MPNPLTRRGFFGWLAALVPMAWRKPNSERTLLLTWYPRQPGAMTYARLRALESAVITQMAKPPHA